MTASPGDVRSIQQALHDVGWPIAVDGSAGPQTHQAVSDFQHGWAAADLVVDGIAGPQTCAALSWSQQNGGRVSAHFAYREFASAGDHWIKVNRHLIRGLELYRERFSPGGVRIVSGYRDPAHNTEAGGVSNSQHLFGGAADVDERVPLDAVRSLHVFSGIGTQRANGLVRHVDVRGIDGMPATTPGTPANPSLWWY